MCRLGRCRWGVLLIIFAAVPLALTAAPDQPQAAGKSGEIRGVVNYCGPGGNNGIVVHLPGRSFQAKVGPGGDFVLNYVPPGTYNLSIEIPSRAPYSVTSVRHGRQHDHQSRPHRHLS